MPRTLRISCFQIQVYVIFTSEVLVSHVLFGKDDRYLNSTICSHNNFTFL